MTLSRHYVAFAALPGILCALLSLGCSSQPSRLYVLSSPEKSAPAQSSMAVAVSGSSQPASIASRAKGRVVGVTVTVPEYLDRLDIVERTSANELKPIYGAQWGESLATTATRAVTENLMARLPSDDIVMMPSRSRPPLDFQVTLDLTKFESDAAGDATLAGRWSISNGEGSERASGRVQRSERVDGTGYDAMAAAMSRNLASTSFEIASALSKLSAEGSPTAPRSRAATERSRR